MPKDDNMKHIHVEIDYETHKKLLKALPEPYMISRLIRRLVKDYIEKVENGANPWYFVVAKKYEEEIK